MSRLLRLLPALLPAVVLFASQALAQGLTPCFQATLGSDDDKVIAVCSGVIKSGGLTGNNLSMAFSNRGLGYLRKREFDRSITDFNEAIRINPKNAFAYDNRGDAWREKGQFDRALTDYNAAIRNDATFASSYLNRGLTFERMGNLQSARADFRTVLALKGDRPIDKWARGEAQRHLTRLDTPAPKK
jgi:tetratricopeptide (TPR) repeat protein